MTDSELKPGALIKAIPTWWTVIAAVVGGIVLTSQTLAKQQDHESRIAELEQVQPAIAGELRDISVAIARLEGKVDTLGEQRDTRE